MTVKITETENPNDTKVLRVEGKLTNGDAVMLKRALDQIEDGEKVAVDLSGVTFIDSDGASVLRHLESEGIELAGIDLFIKAVIESHNDVKEKSIIMSYNPFIKGNHAVGVRTIELAGKDENYTTEIWYPAADEYRDVDALDTFKFVDALPAGIQEATRDAKPADGKRPLIMYWHGGYGHRRELAAMCVFLARHGFVVAAPDFPGDNVTDMYGEKPAMAKEPIDASAKARPRQAAEVIELLVTGNSDFVEAIVDAEKIGSFGLSLGGFTTLSVNAESDRVAASVAIAPAWGKRNPLKQMTRIAPLMRLDWKSQPASLLLAGELDALVVLDDVRELFTMLPEPKQMVVLKNAGHVHWVDNAEVIHEELRTRYASGEFPDPETDGPKMAELMRPFSTLCPAQHATDLMRSVTLAQFDAELKGSTDARAFLEDDLAGKFADRGIDVEIGEKQQAVRA